MIDIELAKRIAREYVQNLPQPCDDSYIVAEQNTREEDFGWVFFYDSERYMQTGEIGYALGGNAPIIVSRENGEVTVTGTAHPLEYYIQKYRD